MHPDPRLKQAKDQVARALRGEVRAPVVQAFFDEPTFTASYVVHDPETMAAAIVDSATTMEARSPSFCSRADAVGAGEAGEEGAPDCAARMISMFRWRR